jgi:DNA-directed RNA polymerase specialized sigma24 family protein
MVARGGCDEAGAVAAGRVAEGARAAPGRREVEERLVLGWTDREIVSDLGIKFQTVRNRVGRARRSWGVRTRVG